MGRFFSTGVSPVQFAEAERNNFKSRTTIQSDGVELQLSLMDMDGRFTDEQKLERARKAMTAQAQRKLDMIGKMSKALGMDVVVHDYMRGSNGYFGEDGKIHFVLSGHMSVARVAAHELTHQMQSVASEKYTVVRDQLIEDVGQDRFDRLLKRKAAQYGYNMESEQGRLACDEEVIAELCEGMLSDKDRLERFAERHTDTALTLKDRLTKILNAIHATLKDTFGQNQNRISDMITDEKTADKWLDGLDEVLKKVQEKQQAKEVKYSIETDGPYSYVKADRQVFTSSNIDTRKVQLENYLNSIIDYTGRLEIPTMDGEVIAITDASTGRTNSVGKLSSYNEHVNKETGEVNAKKIRLKQNIALHIDEVIAVSQKAEGIGTVTDRNFKHDAASQKGWTYRKAVFKDFDGKWYAFLISVPENAVGKFVYNVNKFRERNFETKRPSSEKITGSSLSGAQTEESLNSYYAQNKESVKGKFSLNEAYRKAVSSGNVQEQQKLVEQAAKEAGYTKLFYHGSKKGGGFTTFKNWQYFTENKQYAQRYAGGENGLYTTYVKMENTFDTRQAEARSLFNEARQELGLSKLQENGLPDWTDGYDLSEYIEENDLPYDSIILDEGGDMVNGKPVSRGLSYVIRNPEQIKSADAVTYDDAGNAIPLSERFNMGEKDIRYALDEVDGTYFVRAERNLFVKEDGTPYSEREIFDSLVGKTISLPEGDVKIVRQIPGKKMYKELFQRRPARYNRVRDVSALNQDVNHNMVELLENSTATTINAEDKEKRHAKNDIVGFDTRTVKFFDGKKAYDIEFSIAKIKNGEKVAYAKKFFGYDAAFTKKIQAAKTASDSALSDASKSPVNQQSESADTMTQNGESVNSKFSLDTEQLEKTVRAIDTKALEEGLQSMNAVSNVNSFTMKDPSRFFDAISKGNESLRDELHDIFEKPHSEATGLYARNLEKMQERVKNIAKEAGVLSQDGKKFDKAASAAVQNIGEGIAPIACSVEAKVVEADTISLKATRNDSEILSGNCTLEAQFFEIWKRLVERQSNIKPLTWERLLPGYRRIL